MKKLRLFLFLAVLVALAAAFFLLFNFRIMKSQMAQDSGIAASYNPRDENEVWNFNPATTGLYVGGDERLERRVRQEMVRSLKTNPDIGQVEELDTLTVQADHPLLLVKITQQKYSWTPFLARSAYQVEVGYSSRGDVYFWEKDPPHFVGVTGQPSLQVSGSYAIVDKSWGILTAPGYQDYLASQIAKTILDSLQKELEKM